MAKRDTNWLKTTTSGMSEVQRKILLEIESKDVKIELVEMIGDVLTIKLHPNLLCVVEKNGEMATSTCRKKDQT